MESAPHSTSSFSLARPPEPAGESFSLCSGGMSTLRLEAWPFSVRLSRARAAPSLRRSHRVALDASSLNALVKFRADQGIDDYRESESFLFSNSSDGSIPWLPNWVTKSFIRCRRDAGLPYFRLHDLRHFMATEMLDAGVPISIVSARLAHARASTTLNIYAHAVPGGDRQAAELLALRLLR